MKAYIPIILLALLLAGCSLHDRAGILADRAYAGALRTICHMPVDVQLRAVARGNITARGLMEMCPEYRTLARQMIGEAVVEAVGRLE